MRTQIKRKRVIIASGALLGMGLAAVILISCMDSRRTEEPTKDERMKTLFSEPRPVAIERVNTRSLPRTRRYPGSVTASREVQLAFRVGGPLVAIGVKPGNTVEEGTVLMRIDARDYEDAIGALQARLDGALAQLEKSSNDFTRTGLLLNQRVISQSEHDTARSTFIVAKATVAELEAQLVIARHKLKDTTLRAPFHGVITEQMVENNEMVNVGQVVLAMHDIEQLEIMVNVPESEIQRYQLSTGEYGTVSFPGLPGKQYEAQVKEWNSAAEKDTRSYSVTFGMAAPEDVQILPGMTAEVSWEPWNSGGGEIVAIPASALVPGEDGGDSVWVYKAETMTAEQRTVHLAPSMAGDNVLVLSGLQPGEQIITGGAGYISAGMKVKPVRKVL